MSENTKIRKKNKVKKTRPFQLLIFGQLLFGKTLQISMPSGGQRENENGHIYGISRGHKRARKVWESYKNDVKEKHFFLAG